MDRCRHEPWIAFLSGLPGRDVDVDICGREAERDAARDEGVAALGSPATSIRELVLARSLGTQAVVSSICPQAVFLYA